MRGPTPSAKRKGRPSSLTPFTKSPGPWSPAETARLFAWASPRTLVPPPAACERMAKTLNALARNAALPTRRQPRRALADAARVLLREVGAEAQAWDDGTHPAQRFLLQPGPNRVRGALPVEETGILSLLPSLRKRARGEASADLRALDTALQRALRWLDLRAPGTSDWHGPAYVVAHELRAAWAETGQHFGTKDTSPVVAAAGAALRIILPKVSTTKVGIAAAIERFAPLLLPPRVTHRGDKNR